MKNNHRGKEHLYVCRCNGLLDIPETFFWISQRILDRKLFLSVNRLFVEIVILLETVIVFQIYNNFSIMIY